MKILHRFAKSFIPVLLAALIVMLALPSLGSAQNTANVSPNTIAAGYSFAMPVAGYPDSTNPKIYANRVDTFYAKYWINRSTAAYQSPEYYRLGFFNRSSITIEVNDTASIAITVKYRTKKKSTSGGAASAWSAAIITDSLQSLTAGGIVKEFSIVDTDSDLFDALDTELLIITTVNAWGLDYTANAAGTLRRRVWLNYAP